MLVPLPVLLLALPKLPIRDLPPVLHLLEALPRLMLLKVMLHPQVVLKALRVLLKLRRPRRPVEIRLLLIRLPLIRVLKKRLRQLKVLSRKPRKT